MKQQVAVIGLGRFGSAVAEALVKEGHEVLGIDSDLAVVQRMAPVLSHVVQADALEQQTLERLGLAEFDAGVVAVSGSLETSILATLVLKRLGVSRVIAKAATELHGEILTRVGADRVMFPERDTGLRLAHSWSSFDITDSLEVIEGYVVSRLEVPTTLVGHTVGDVAARQPGLSLMLLARGARVTEYPHADEELHAGDTLVLAGQIHELEAFFGALERPEA